MNLLDTGGKYCKRYTLLESKEVKTRNGKFELVVEKFISFDYLLNAFLREVFLVHRKSLSILIKVMIVQLYSTLQLPSYTHWLYRYFSRKIPLFGQIRTKYGHLICVNYHLGFMRFGHFVNYKVLSVNYVTHSKKFSLPLDAWQFTK